MAAPARILPFALLSALLLHPLSAAAQSLLKSAASALAQGDLSHSEELYLQAIEEYPNSSQGHRGLARVRARQGRPKEAASILLFLGEGFTGLALYDEAIEALQEALVLAPESIQLHAAQGRALMLQGKRLAEAEKHLTRACEGGQAEMTIRLYLAAARWELGRFEEAEALYRDLLAESPGTVFVQYQLARLLLTTGRHAEALDLLERAAMRQRDDPELQTDLARTLANQGQPERAEAAYREAIELDPSRKQAHYGLARLLLARGDREASKAQMEIYRRLTLEEHDRVREAELASLQVEKGWGLLRNGDPEAAIRLLSGLVESDEALLGIASAYTALQDRKAAVEALERALALAPQRADLQLRLVEARLALEESKSG